MAKGVLLGMLAETPLHPGAGQSAGVVDLPVAREGATGLPHIPETGLKGALKQWAKQCGADLDIDRLFGRTDGGEEQSPSGAGDAHSRIGAGELVISTARLLCLPVRRLDGPYAWATCPYLLERLKRDSDRVGLGFQPPTLAPADGEEEAQLLVADGTPEGATAFLEEYAFKASKLHGSAQSDLRKSLGALIGVGANGALGKKEQEKARQELEDRLVSQIAVMSNREFKWFAENGLPVDARNKLDEVTKMSENLWYEETIPPDAMFYALILPRNPAPKQEAASRWKAFFGELGKAGYVQVGGNETVGHGWVRLAVIGA